MVKLEVYIAAECWSCQETERIVADMRSQFPEIAIEMLDSATIVMPENVFAVPTYVLNGRVISLGNPTRESLSRQLSAAAERCVHP
jgi:alkyl hydroperoxide reductase subunit AhpF